MAIEFNVQIPIGVRFQYVSLRKALSKGPTILLSAVYLWLSLENLQLLILDSFGGF